MKKRSTLESGFQNTALIRIDHEKQLVKITNKTDEVLRDVLL